jgi:hypothetical protein
MLFLWLFSPFYEKNILRLEKDKKTQNNVYWRHIVKE